MQKKLSFLFKSVIFILILTLIIKSIYFAVNFQKYKFGHFVKGLQLKHQHGGSNENTFKLDNGNIFILGKNDDNGNYTPSEIYDIKTNKVKEIILPKNLYYWDNGLLLNNNKLLITHAYDSNNSKYKLEKAYPYDSMVILNLDTMKFEKLIEKKINNTLEPVRCFNIMNAALFDDKVFMYQRGKVEIYNIDKNTSELMNISLDKFLNVDQVFPTKENDILLFGSNILSKDKEKKVEYGDLDYVYKYNYKSNTIKTAGKVLRRVHPRRIKIDDSRIVIFGGKAALPDSNSKYREITELKEIEIYNINTGKAEVVANLLEPRCYEFMGAGGFNGAKLGDKYFLITGGKCFLGPMFGIKSKTSPKDSEILDLETYEIQHGPKAKQELAGQKMITLNNGNIFIFLSQRAGNNRGTQFFKQWRINK